MGSIILNKGITEPGGRKILLTINQFYLTHRRPIGCRVRNNLFADFYRMQIQDMKMTPRLPEDKTNEFMAFTDALYTSNLTCYAHVINTICISQMTTFGMFSFLLLIRFLFFDTCIF